MATYHLPNHVSRVTNDPLGLTDSSEENIGLWPVLSELLADSSPKTPGEFIDLLETVAYTVHTQPQNEFGCLKAYLQNAQSDGSYAFSLGEVFSNILKLALELPVHFPTGEIDVLRPNEPVSFTRKALGVLLAHQTLGTLACPSWNDWGGVNLGQWYSDKGGQESTKHAYMNLAFRYMSNLSKEAADSDYAVEPIEFLLHAPDVPDWGSLECPLLPLQVCEQEIEDDLPFSAMSPSADGKQFNNALVISCHPLVGHGPSATQEERIVASYPELLPVSILTPPVSPTASLIVTGSRFYPTGRFNGHGRTATLKETYRAPQRKAGLFNTFIFMDASQRDLEDDSQELAFMERDAMKAYSGFLGALTGSRLHLRILTIPWGAGAFGGNLLTNLRMLWVGSSAAAARTSSAELVFLVKKGLLEQFDPDWTRNFEATRRDLSVGNAWKIWHDGNTSMLDSERL